MGKRKPIGIRKLLAALVLGAVAPVLVLALAISWRLAEAERQVVEAHRFDQVNRLTIIMDGEIAAIQFLMEYLARSPEMQDENFGSVRDRALRMVGDQIAIIAVQNSTGQHVMSTAVSPTDPLPVSQNMAFTNKVLAGRSAVSDILIGTAARRPVVAVAVPVFIHGEVKYALGAVIFSERFSSVFTKAGIEPAWTLAIVDHEGRFIARNLDADKLVGSIARPEVRVAAGGREDRGVFANVTMEGLATESSFWRSAGTGWTSVVAVPTDVLYASYYRTILGVLAVAASAIFCGSLCIVVVARRIASEVRQLGQAATALVEGKQVSLIASSVLEFQEVQVAYRHAEVLAQQKYRDEQRIEFLVHELTHRAKNVLTVIQAIARKSIRAAPSLNHFILEFEGSLASLAISQDLLVGQPSSGISLSALLHQQLAPFPSDAIKIHPECERFTVPPGLFQPLGMAVYELATNSIKYGSLSAASGQVDVSCQPSDGSMIICWRESGGPAVEPSNRKGFGSYVIREFVAASVGGTVDIQYEGGLRWALFVPTEPGVPP